MRRCAAATLALFALAATQNVSVEVTDEDREYLAKFLPPTLKPRTDTTSFDEEITTIRAVQRAVLDIAPLQRSLPKRAPREPRQLYEARYGMCFDRSRVIEKALASLGYEVRHIFAFIREDNAPVFITFLSSKVRSHAISEVKTQKGWLVVDSNAPWISLAADGTPLGIAAIQRDAQNGIRFADPDEHRNLLYTSRFVFLYGFFSRHGYFYPPYTPFPDVNLAELAQNFAPAD